MKSVKWMKKTLVVLVSILTFGMVSPSDFNWLTEEGSANGGEKSTAEKGRASYLPLAEAEPDRLQRESYIEEWTALGAANAYRKFGDKIKPRIEDEFNDLILPKMEEAIAAAAEDFHDDELKSLSVSEKPSSGRGERIFNLYDQETGKDIIRFHVRQENPPQQGYWFDFHYHTSADSYEGHYQLGRIYWDKNTPPKWHGGENQLH